jgi:hypothetical protein
LYSRFEELNLHVYHSAQGLVYDGVIWCLGPLVNDTRKYGLARLYLAAATYRICRRVLGIAD